MAGAVGEEAAAEEERRRRVCRGAMRCREAAARRTSMVCLWEQQVVG
jgi:hypothetical protein